MDVSATCRWGTTHYWREFARRACKVNVRQAGKEEGAVSRKTGTRQAGDGSQGGSRETPGGQFVAEPVSGSHEPRWVVSRYGEDLTVFTSPEAELLAAEYDAWKNAEAFSQKVVRDAAPRERLKEARGEAQHWAERVRYWEGKLERVYGAHQPEAGVVEEASADVSGPDLGELEADCCPAELDVDRGADGRLILVPGHWERLANNGQAYLAVMHGEWLFGVILSNKAGVGFYISGGGRLALPSIQRLYLVVLPGEGEFTVDTGWEVVTGNTPGAVDCWRDAPPAYSVPQASVTFKRVTNARACPFCKAEMWLVTDLRDRGGYAEWLCNGCHKRDWTGPLSSIP